MAALEMEITGLAEATQMTGVDEQISVKIKVKPTTGTFTIAQDAKAYVQVNFTQTIDATPTEVVISQVITGATGGTTITVDTPYELAGDYYVGTTLTADEIATVFTNQTAKIFGATYAAS